MRHSEVGEFCGDGLPVHGGTHPLVDEQDAAVSSNVERPPRCKRLIRVDHTVGASGLTRGIAQNRIVHAERLREILVDLRRIDTRRKIYGIEGSDFFAALTERLAFGGSRRCKRFRKPRQDDDLATFVVGKSVRFPVGTWERERRRGIADFELDGCGIAGRRVAARVHRRAAAVARCKGQRDNGGTQCRRAIPER